MKRSHEPIVDRPIDEQPRTGVTDLAHVGKDSAVRGGDCAIEVRDVGQEHLRRLAAAFERDLFHVRLAGVLQ